MSTFRFPNSKVWWYDFQFNRKRYRGSTKTRSRTLAREVERAKRREAEDEANGDNSSDRTQGVYAGCRGISLKEGSYAATQKS